MTYSQIIKYINTEDFKYFLIYIKAYLLSIASAVAVLGKEKITVTAAIVCLIFTLSFSVFIVSTLLQKLNK